MGGVVCVPPVLGSQLTNLPRAAEKLLVLQSSGCLLLWSVPMERGSLGRGPALGSCPGHEEVKEPLALCLGRDFAKSDPAFRRGNACVEAHLGHSIAWRTFARLLAQAGPALRGVLYRQEK